MDFKIGDTLPPHGKGRIKDLKELWTLMCNNPRNKDLVNSFNRSCTPYVVHLLLEELTALETIKNDY